MKILISYIIRLISEVSKMKKLLVSILLSIFVFSLHAEEVEESPVVILGGGMGALTSATYLARAGIIPVVITGPTLGGTITLSTEVQNWPGEIAISGDVLSEKLYKQAEFNGALLQSEVVVSVDFSKRPYTVVTRPLFGESIKTYKTNSCIIALGATPNLLGVPGEMQYLSRGVYTCAVCDGSLYKGKTVAVVGGGDSALIEAQYLSNIAKKVYVLVRGKEFRAVEMKRAAEVLALPNVEVLFETTIQEIKGDSDKMTRLCVENKKMAHVIEADALFLAIGARPNTELFRGQLELDSKGYIALKKYQETSVEGVYAIGDVADPEFKQAVSAAGDGAKAALQVQKYLACVSNQKPMASVAKAASLDSHKAIEISSREQFARELKGAQGPVFVDFYATRCGPCKMFSPLYESWARDFHGKIKFLKVNADHMDELFREYHVNVVPTLIVFDANGKIVQKSTGSREIAKVEKCLQKVKDKPEITSQDFAW
jgi:thioredoxin reductase (NADPH)